MPVPLDRLAVLAGRSWRVSSLPGGLTNTNLRVTTDEELEGLDRSQHAETAYALNELMSNLGTLTHAEPAKQPSHQHQ